MITERQEVYPDKPEGAKNKDPRAQDSFQGYQDFAQHQAVAHQRYLEQQWAAALEAVPEDSMIDVIDLKNLYALLGYITWSDPDLRQRFNKLAKFKGIAHSMFAGLRKIYWKQYLEGWFKKRFFSFLHLFFPEK